MNKKIKIILLYCYVVVIVFIGCFGFINFSYAKSCTCEDKITYDGVSNELDCVEYCSNVLLPGSVSCTIDDCKAKKPSCKKYCGNYSVNDFLGIFTKVSGMILGVVGALALLAFVVGGFMFMFSGGNQNWVARGKATIIGAVIGLAIVFFSYTIIKFSYDIFAPESRDDPFESGYDPNSAPGPL